MDIRPNADASEYTKTERQRFKELYTRYCALYGQGTQPSLISRFTGTSLNLTYRPMGAEPLRPVLHALRGRTITELHLEETGMQERGAIYLAEALPEYLFLKFLQCLLYLLLLFLFLSNIISGLVSDKHQNHNLHVSGLWKYKMYNVCACDNSLYHGQDTGVTSNIHQGSFCDPLTNVSHNRLQNSGFAAIVDGLVSLGAVEILNVSGNYLDDNAGESIHKLLNINRSLKHLDISENSISAHTSHVISQALGGNTSLHTLKMNWCEIDYHSAVFICRGIQVNTILTVLDLSHNCLHDFGALAVSELLKKNKSLQDLNISSNGLTWEAATFIANSLRQNNMLRIMKLGDNPLTTHGCMDIIQAIHDNRNSALEQLDIQNVPIVAGLEALVANIQNRQAFLCKHGRVVQSHDVLGKKTGRDREPMDVFIYHMKQKKLRPLELFRDMDKKVSQRISDTEFIRRIKMLDLPLYVFEIVELIQTITETEDISQTFTIDYVNLLQSIRKHELRKRLDKHAHEENRKRTHELHRKVLSSER